MELYSGKPGPAIAHAQEAITLNPVFPGWYLYVTAAAEYFGGRAEQALATLDRVLKASPGLVLAKVLRVAALQSLGRSDAARSAAREIRSIEPDLSSERLTSTQPFQDTAKRDHYLAVLRDVQVEFEDVECELETDAALLCWIDGEKHWIPKSQVDDDSEVYAEGHKGQLVVSQWICEQKGLA